MGRNALPFVNARFISVIEMAEGVEMSRDRFHDLVVAGVFPPPVYDLRTRRPYYTIELQQACLRVKETGIGFQGQPILFNRKKCSRKARRVPSSTHHDLNWTSQAHAWATRLRHLGVEATINEVSAALIEGWPNGSSDIAEDEILKGLCRRLGDRRESGDRTCCRGLNQHGADAGN